MTTAEATGPPVELIIGLDVGTTATKAVAYEVGAARRHTAIREYPLLAPEPGWQVQEPQAIRTAVLDALTECVAATESGTVVAIAVSTAMHGLIGLDRLSEPLTPMITWADARSRDEARGLRASGVADAVYRTSGTPVHPMTPLTKLMWFTRHEPELSTRARWWAGLKDYVLATLTGTLVTELSSASGTAMLDLSTRDLNPAAIELAGIRADQLPPSSPRQRSSTCARTSPHVSVCRPVLRWSWGRVTVRSGTSERRRWSRASSASPWARAAACVWSCRSRCSIRTAGSSATP